MNNYPKTLNKYELLDWLNAQISSDGIHVDQIEHLGNGVGYLVLLNKLHPGALGPAGSKFNKKPKGEWENLANLKLMMNSLIKLGISKNFDIAKLSKMRMQDNLHLLQWFYSYAQSVIKKDEANKIDSAPSRSQKLKIKTPIIIKQTAPKKRDGDDVMKEDQQPKTVSFSCSRLRQISEVLSEGKENEIMKLNRIRQILSIGQQKNSNSDVGNSPYPTLEPEQKEEQTESQENDKLNDELTYQEQKKSEEGGFLAEYRSQSLEEKCSQYLKKSEELESRQTESQANQRTSPQSQQDQENNPDVLNRTGRQTDTSLLLNSERKSVISEPTLLNDQNDLI